MDSHPRAADNRPPPGIREGAVKLGYFHNGHFPPIDFEGFVRWGAANGYQAIDVPLFEPNARAICDRHGLEPTSTVGMICQPIATDPELRAEEVAQARSALNYAAAEHIPNVWLGHEMAPDLDFDANVRLFAEGVAPVLDYAERVDVRLVMENWANGGRNLAYAPAHWAAIFDAVPHPALGLCPDPSHLVWLGIDYLRAVREFGSRVYHAHAKDTEFLPDTLYQYGVIGVERGRVGQGTYRFRIPGFGVVDWPAYITALLDVGYNGALVVEHEDAFWSSQIDAEHALNGLVLAQRFLSPLLI